jgi:DNA-binding transcriptional regulator YhcF (GntR family)
MAIRSFWVTHNYSRGGATIGQRNPESSEEERNRRAKAARRLISALKACQDMDVDKDSVLEIVTHNYSGGGTTVGQRKQESSEGRNRRSKAARRLISALKACQDMDVDKDSVLEIVGRFYKDAKLLNLVRQRRADAICP